MKKVIIVSIIAVALITVIGASVYKSDLKKSKKIDISVTYMKERKLENTIKIPGTLKLANEQYVYFDAEKGEVERFHVTEGSYVQRGTSLLTYESDELDLEQEQNQLVEESSQLQIDSVSKQISNLNKKQNN